MSYRSIFVINAVILAVFGLFLMIMPEYALNQFGTEVYVSTLYVVRFMGGAILVGGLLLWFLSDASPAKLQKNASYILLASSVGGFILVILGMTSIGVLRNNGWMLLVAFGLFALLYAYLLFLQPKSSESKSRSPRKSTQSTAGKDPS